MMDLLQIYFIAFVIAFLVFLITYLVGKRYENIATACWNSATDAATLNSGVILLIHVVGKLFKIEWLVLKDDYVLLVAIFIAGLLIIGSSIDKLSGNETRSKNNGKTH